MIGILTGIVVLAIAGGAYWYFSQQGADQKTTNSKSSGTATAKKTAVNKPATRPQNSNPYAAVSIQCKSGACEAAIMLKGKRFLVKEAPPIPLPECNTATCQCTYQRYDDRRKEEDERRNVHGLQTQLHAQTTGHERRKRRGRRKTDHT